LWNGEGERLSCAPITIDPKVDARFESGA
jgi:hypothetical protein